MWLLSFATLSTSCAVCLAVDWNSSAPQFADADSHLRAAISDCFSQGPQDSGRDGVVYVTNDDVRLTPSDWWPPGPLTLNMILVMIAVCSHELRASTNHCISEVYLSTPGNDLQVNMAMALLPVPEAWEEAHRHMCTSTDELRRDLSCVRHRQFSVRECWKGHLQKSNHQRFLLCRQVDAAEACQRDVYTTCSRHTARALAAVSRILNPAMCPSFSPNVTGAACACQSVNVTLTLVCLLILLHVATSSSSFSFASMDSSKTVVPDIYV